MWTRIIDVLTRVVDWLGRFKDIWEAMPWLWRAFWFLFGPGLIVWGTYEISLPVAGKVFFFVVVTAIWTWTAYGFHLLKAHRRVGPKLVCDALDARNIEGEFHVRVRVRSSEDMSNVTAYLEGIECEDQLREVASIDFPVPLFTQQRLQERIACRDRAIPALPVRLRKGQPKWLEVFQITEPIYRAIHLYLPNGRADLTPLPLMTFRCNIYGAGEPVGFSVTYEERSDWQVELTTDGRTIGPKEPVRGD